MKKTTHLIISILIVAFVAFNSCTTTCPDPTPVTENITNTVWTMHYFEGTSGNDVFYAAPTFIKNGVATYPATLPHGRLWFAEYTLPVPPEIDLDLNTDSIKLVANVKNPSGDGTAFEIDLGFLSDSSSGASWQKGSDPLFCTITVGSQTSKNITEQLIDPTNYAELAFNIQNNTANTFKNGVLTKSITYTGNNTAVGRLKRIGVAFRGYGSIDWVKLYKGSKLIMSEDFNTNGETTAIWTMP
ncbi:MAG TPA: hypothetical protein PLS10_03085 [Chitinophagales bacterium]|nr:hypothetical protein [Chitinophagales bacterium]